MKLKGGQIKDRLSMSPKEKEDLVTILYYVVVYKDIRSRVGRKNTSTETEHLLPSRGNTPGAEAHLQGVPEISSQVLKQPSAQKTQGLLIFHIRPATICLENGSLLLYLLLIPRS